MGLIIAVWAWQTVHPVAGLVVGFLFVGGLGWRAIGFVVGSLRPSARRAYGKEGKEFIAAWEAHFGALKPGGRNHPPSGTFQRWLRSKRSSGISAGAWLDSQLSPAVEWIERPSDEGSDDERGEPGDNSSIIAWCEVLTDSPLRKYPLMMSKTEPEGLTLTEVPDFSTFACLEWADLYSWERLAEHDSEGNWVWLLTTLDTDKLPQDVIGLAIREPSDIGRWERLLEEFIPSAAEEEE